MTRFSCSAFGMLLAVLSLSLGCADKGDPNPKKDTAAPDAVTPPAAPVGDAMDSKVPVVTLTAKAANSIREIIAAQGLPEPWYLRLRIVPGGCSGFMHKLDLDPVATKDDFQTEASGVRVVMPKGQVEMMRGTIVDFVDEREKRGFKISNPRLEREGLKKWLPLLEREKLAD